jgi:hypothetical protein
MGASQHVVVSVSGRWAAAGPRRPTGDVRWSIADELRLLVTLARSTAAAGITPILPRNECGLEQELLEN